MHDPEVAGVLKRSKVGIAGAGGLGSNVAVSLARAGVGQLTIVDFDLVEKDNLNRQYYFIDQVGRSKVEALKENIERTGAIAEVRTMNVKLRKGKMHEPFRDADVIVEALDDARTKADFIIGIQTKLKETPLVAASGVAGYGGSERIKLERFGNLYLVQDHKARSSDIEVLLSPKVGLFAHYQANLVLEILLGGSR